MCKMLSFLKENDYRDSPTKQMSEDLSSRSEPASCTQPIQAEPTTAVHTACVTGSDSHVSARSETPISISFDELSEDPIPLKGCVLWNRRAFTVRTRASAREKR